MKEYRKILEFKYKNQKYNMYLDSNNKHFFLKVDDYGNLSYITIEELIILSKLFLRDQNIMMIENTKNEKIKIVPKIITGSGAVILTASILLSVFFKIPNIDEHTTEQSEQTETSYETILEEDQLLGYFSSYDDIEYNKDYYYDKYCNYLFIFNTDYIGNVLTEEVNLEKLYEIIDENNNINERYKELLKNYVKDVSDKYPNAELRMLYNNLKTLKIVECSSSQMLDMTGNHDCYGFYKRQENEIYVLEDNEYKKGTWEYQVIYHELSHVLRNTYIDAGDTKISIQTENRIFNNDITQEVLNSLFAVSLFDYEETLIAYQLQSNYYSIMIDCANYDLTNYINKPLSDFPEKLNEYNKDEEGTAEDILELIKVQFYDYSNDNLIVENETYDQIIDYICDMYFRKYINDDVSYDEAQSIAKTLEDKITCNVPEKYNINTERIYQNLDEYMNSLNFGYISKVV